MTWSGDEVAGSNTHYSKAVMADQVKVLSSNCRFENEASASSYSFRIKENAQTQSGQGFPKSFFCGLSDR